MSISGRSRSIGGEIECFTLFGASQKRVGGFRVCSLFLKKDWTRFVSDSTNLEKSVYAALCEGRSVRVVRSGISLAASRKNNAGGLG